MTKTITRFYNILGTSGKKQIKVKLEIKSFIQNNDEVITRIGITCKKIN